MRKTQLVIDAVGLLRSAPKPFSNKRFGPCTYQLFAGAEQFLLDLHTELARATSCVDMQFYTFECDGVGEPIANALLRLNNNHVKVRLMVDDYINLAHNDKYIRVPRLNRELQRSIVNEWRSTQLLLKKMSVEGIGVKITNPLTWAYRNALRRDHRKIVVIDGDIPEKAVAYIGAINPSEHNAAWNDFMVKMSGDMIPLLRRDLNLTWRNGNTGGIYPYSDGLVMAEVHGFPVVIPMARSLILNAKKRIVLESAYLWGKEMTSALTTAAESLDVSVIVPSRNHKHLFTLSEKALRQLARLGVRVYRLNTPNGMTHARALLADDCALIGSNAFNDFLSGVMGELNLITGNESMVRQLSRFLDDDIRHSTLQ